MSIRGEGIPGTSISARRGGAVRTVQRSLLRNHSLTKEGKTSVVTIEAWFFITNTRGGNSEKKKREKHASFKKKKGSQKKGGEIEPQAHVSQESGFLSASGREKGRDRGKSFRAFQGWKL